MISNNVKEIAHSYVAEKVTGKRDPNLYIGCLLPDLTPYTLAAEILGKVDLHDEGGVSFYDYLQNKVPEDIFLAIGILSHSRLYGADRYNDLEYRGNSGYAHQKKEPLIDEVKECSGISYEIAQIRAHNFIELGIDYLLLQKDPELVRRIGEALSAADLEKIAWYLSDCFQLDREKILAGLHQLFSAYRLRDLKSVDGLARIWSRQAAGLPEHDIVNVEKATRVIRKAADLIKNDYKEFLSFTIESVHKNLKPFLVEVG